MCKGTACTCDISMESLEIKRLRDALNDIVILHPDQLDDAYLIAGKALNPSNRLVP